MQGPVQGKCVLVEELCCRKCEYKINSGGDGCNHVLSAIVTKKLYIFPVWYFVIYLCITRYWFPINQCTLPVFNLYLLCI